MGDSLYGTWVHSPRFEIHRSNIDSIRLQYDRHFAIFMQDTVFRGTYYTDDHRLCFVYPDSGENGQRIDTSRWPFGLNGDALIFRFTDVLNDVTRFIRAE